MQNAMSTASLEDLLAQWLEDLRANDHAAGTVRRYKSVIESFLLWYAQEEDRPLLLEALTPITLISYRNWVQHTQSRATSTVNGHLSALKAWCAWLTEHRHLETNPAKRLKLVGHQEASSREGLKPTQVNALLRQVQASRDGERNYAIVQVLLQTGVRLDECSHLHLEDIEFGERSGRVTIRHGKGNKARSVPLNASARQALADYLAPQWGCDPTTKAVAARWPRPNLHTKPSPLWRSQKGGALTTSAMRQMLDGVVRTASARGSVPTTTSAPRCVIPLLATIWRSILAMWWGWPRCSGTPLWIPHGCIASPLWNNWAAAWNV